MKKNYVKKPQKDVAQEITDKIIADMEAGVCPWERPWSSNMSAPMNPASGTSYRGINTLVLWMNGQNYNSNKWVTFKQARDNGGTVKKNEKGITVVYYKKLSKKEEKENNNGELEESINSFWVMKAYTVFNIDQCDGLEKWKVQEDESLKNEFTPVEVAEELIASSKADVRHSIQAEAYYSPREDYIHLPEKKCFKDETAYYVTALHELTHWTGHKTRLDRLDGSRFGSEEYAFEELVAELGAAFLASSMELEYQTQHASYITVWLKKLKNDKKFIFKAASKAQKAMDFLSGELRQYDDKPEKEVATA